MNIIFFDGFTTLKWKAQLSPNKLYFSGFGFTFFHKKFEKSNFERTWAKLSWLVAVVNSTLLWYLYQPWYRLSDILIAIGDRHSPVALPHHIFLCEMENVWTATPKKTSNNNYLVSQMYFVIH